jgi:glutamate racemase
MVIACNTATAAAIHLLRAEYPGLTLIGVEPALKPAVALSRTGRIGVMATRSTLASAKFTALLASQTGGASFVVQACDGLADAIERSAETGDTAETMSLCARYTGAMGLFGTQTGQIDTLVLGCTHYPFASDQLRAMVGAGVQIIDNGEAIARQTRRLLHGQEIASAAPGQVSLFTTGQPYTLQAAAGRWLGLSDPVKTLLI